MKIVRFIAALIALSGAAMSISIAAPRQPAPKVLPKPGASGFPGISASQRGTIGGPVSKASGVNGTGLRKPH
jgi:hypothetical protein